MGRTMRNRVCERELLTFIFVSPKCRCASPAASSSNTCGDSSHDPLHER